VPPYEDFDVINDMKKIIYDNIFGDNYTEELFSKIKRP
jgi:hypothetical protein